MMFIVFEHSAHSGIYIYPDLSIKHLVYMGIIQIAKPGTIAFFILAGFLIGSKFKDYSPSEYFKRRLSSTFIPWMVWSLVFVCTMSLKFWIVFRKDNNFNLFSMILGSFKTVYLYSNYWFIINFLICIGILLLFRKHLYSKILGSVLFAFTLIYSINIHYEWFPPMHTMAIFGFVFFLWLGAQMNKNWDFIKKWIEKTPNFILLILFVLSFTLSIFEISGLFLSKSIDPYNTLRFSNILYSLISIAILLKIRNFNFTKFFLPRETTFGIYLVHYIIVFNIIPEILRPLHIPLTQNLSIIGLISISLMKFIIVYSLSFGLVYALNKTRYKWIIGR